MIKPDFDKLWLEFPDHIKYKSMKDLFSALGGAAEKIYIPLALVRTGILVQVD